MNATDLRTQVLLTLQVALLGMVTSSMRAVAVAWSETHVHVRVIFDRTPTPDDLEIVSEIEAEVMSHLPEHDVACEADSSRSTGSARALQGEAFVFQRAPA